MGLLLTRIVGPITRTVAGGDKPLVVDGDGFRSRRFEFVDDRVDVGIMDEIRRRHAPRHIGRKRLLAVAQRHDDAGALHGGQAGEEAGLLYILINHNGFWPRGRVTARLQHVFGKVSEAACSLDFTISPADGQGIVCHGKMQHC